MSEIMDRLIEDSKIKSLALMLQDEISEEKACWYLQIPLERRGEMLSAVSVEIMKKRGFADGIGIGPRLAQEVNN